MSRDEEQTSENLPPKATEMHNQLRSSLLISLQALLSCAQCKFLLCNSLKDCWKNVWPLLQTPLLSLNLQKGQLLLHCAKSLQKILHEKSAHTIPQRFSSLSSSKLPDLYQIVDTTTLGCQGCCDEMNSSYDVIFVHDKGFRVLQSFL